MSETIQLSNNGRPKAPSESEVVMRFSPEAVHELESLRSHYPTLKACMLPALWLAQREYGGFLSPEALTEVAIRLNRPYSEVEGVATFYSLYNVTHVPGRHKLELCTCLSCAVNGAFDLRDHIVRKLGIRHGETTADGTFTFEEVECLNACDRAPVAQVGDQYYGPLDEKKADELIEALRNNPESTTVQYANTVVSVQLRDTELPSK